LDVSRAFDAAMKEKVDAIRVGIDGTTRPNRQLIIDLAETNKIPAIYAAKEFVEDGGLMAYATNYAELYSRAATFVDKIFKGANPADLPIERPTKLELSRRWPGYARAPASSMAKLSPAMTTASPRLISFVTTALTTACFYMPST
jgi:hypothetical protein